MPNQQMTTEQALKESRLALGALSQAGVCGHTQALENVIRAQQTLLESIAAAIAPKPAPPAPPKPKCVPFSELVSFNLCKRLAERALQEQAEQDPKNLLVQETVPRLGDATTFEELDALLEDTCEDDWLRGFIRERSLELIGDLIEAAEEANPR